MPVFKNHDPFEMPLKTFTSLMFDLIRMKQLNHVGNCFSLVERFLTCGDASVKFALINTFIPDLHSYLLDCCYRQEIVDMMPSKMRKEYCRHASFTVVRNDYVHFTVHLN